MPSIYWFGTEGEYNIMIMDLLGPSLEDLFNYCSRKFSLKTTIMVADQLVLYKWYIIINRYQELNIYIQDSLYTEI